MTGGARRLRKSQRITVPPRNPMKSLTAVSTSRDSRRRARVRLAVRTAVAALLCTAVTVLLRGPISVPVTSTSGMTAAQSASSYQAPDTPPPSVAGGTTPVAPAHAAGGALDGE